MPCVARSKFSRGEAARAAARTFAGVKLADELIRLGPTYVKVGQIVPCREGLLPPEVLVGLARLQDKVPAFDGARAATLAAATLGRSLDEVRAQSSPSPPTYDCASNYCCCAIHVALSPQLLEEAAHEVFNNACAANQLFSFLPRPIFASTGLFGVWHDSARGRELGPGPPRRP